MPSKMKSLIKAGLTTVGLKDTAQRLSRRLDHRRLQKTREEHNTAVLRKYGHLERFETHVDETHVVFGTEDAYSKRWFYPRYLDAGIHEEAATRLILDRIEEGPFIDVGANLGWFTCVVANRYPECRVFSFEMDDLNYELLESNIALNGCDNVSPYKVAVSNSVEPVQYCRQTPTPSAAFRLNGGQQAPSAGETLSVNSIRLDDFFEREDLAPESIKIDVEGAEFEVLRGMRSTLSRKVPRSLFVEIHPQFLPHFQATPGEVLELLQGHGYRVFEIEDFREAASPHLEPLAPGHEFSRDTMILAERC